MNEVFCCRLARSCESRAVGCVTQASLRLATVAVLVRCRLTTEIGVAA